MKNFIKFCIINIFLCSLMFATGKFTNPVSVSSNCTNGAVFPSILASKGLNSKWIGWTDVDLTDPEYTGNSYKATSTDYGMNWYASIEQTVVKEEYYYPYIFYANYYFNLNYTNNYNRGGITWYDNRRNELPAYEIMFKKYLSGTHSFAANDFDSTVIITDIDGSNSVNPDIYFYSNNIFLVWEDYATGNGDIYFKTCLTDNDPGDSTNWSNPPVNLTAGNNAVNSFPRITIFQDTIFIVYLDNTSGNNAIYLIISNDNGNNFSSPVLVCNSNCTYPDITANTEGIHIVWSAVNNSKYNLYYKMYEFSDSPINTWPSADSELISNQNSNALYPSIEGENRQLYIAYSSDVNDTNEIYFLRRDQLLSYPDTINAEIDYTNKGIIITYSKHYDNDIDTYYLFKSTDGVNFDTIASFNTQFDFYVDTDNIYPNQTYSYYIKAVSKLGIMGEYSSIAAKQVVISVPILPKNISLSYINSIDAIMMSWDTSIVDSQAIKYIKIYRSTSVLDMTGDTNLIDTISNDTVYYFDKSIVFGENYRYGIKTLNAFGVESTDSKAISLSLGGIESIVFTEGDIIKIVYLAAIDTNALDTNNYTITNINSTIPVVISTIYTDTNNTNIIFLKLEEYQTFGDTYTIKIENVLEITYQNEVLMTKSSKTFLKLKDKKLDVEVKITVINKNNTSETVDITLPKGAVTLPDTYDKCFFEILSYDDLSDTIKIIIDTGIIKINRNPFITLLTGIKNRIMNFDLLSGPGGENIFGDTITEDEFFDTPAIIKYHYNNDLLAQNNINEDNLRMFRLNPVKKNWEIVNDVINGNKVNTLENYVEVHLLHFSQYTILPVNFVTNIDYNNITVFPNPWRPNAFTTHAAHNIKFFNLPNDIYKIDIYTLEGRLARTLDKDNESEIYYQNGINLIAEWDGRNNGGISVASGIYFYVVYNSDKSPVFRGKIAVIR